MDITDPLTAGTAPPEPVKLQPTGPSQPSPTPVDDHPIPTPGEKRILLRRPSSAAQPGAAVAAQVEGRDGVGVGGNDHDREARPRTPTQSNNRAGALAQAAEEADSANKGDDVVVGGTENGEEDVLDEAVRSALTNPRDRLLLLRVEMQLQGFLAATS